MQQQLRGNAQTGGCGNISFFYAKIIFSFYQIKQYVYIKKKCQ